MDLKAKPLQNPAVLSRKILDDEMVLVNADNAASMALTNQTAIQVWLLVDGQNSIQNIIDGIRYKFSDVPDEVEDDVKDLLKILTRDGFIGFEHVSAK